MTYSIKKCLFWIIGIALYSLFFAVIGYSFDFRYWLTTLPTGELIVSLVMIFFFVFLLPIMIIAEIIKFEKECDESSKEVKKLLEDLKKKKKKRKNLW